MSDTGTKESKGAALEKLRDWFEWQVGTRESGVNNVIYNTHYYGTEVSGAQFPWCCAFIWDGFHQTGLSALFCGGEKTAYCPYVVGWAKARGRWIAGDYKEGDLLLYDWDGDGVADHIGFCLSFNGEYAAAIEGNSNDAVERTLRPRSAIMGAYRPEYPEEETDKERDAAAERPLGEERRESYTVKRGDTLWGIAEALLGDGLRWQEIYWENSLRDTILHPGDVLYIPGITERVTLTLTVEKDTARRLRARAEAADASLGEIIDRMVKEG